MNGNSNFTSKKRDQQENLPSLSDSTIGHFRDLTASLQQDTIPQSHFARAQANIDARSKKLQNLQRGIAESGDEREVLDDFLRYLSIESTLETRYMAYDRIARLQLGSLSSFIVQRGFDDVSAEKLQAQALDWVMIYYNSHYLDFSSQCEQENLFSPFYRRLILGIHEIGNSMNALHQKWRERIFENRQQLLSEFHGNHQEILDFLSKEGLQDLGHNGEIADRCYSVLHKDGSDWKVQTYAEAFPDYIGEIVFSIGELTRDLDLLDDPIYGQKDAYYQYFFALALALSQTERDSCVASWSKVDIAWMAITSPFQPVHPIEYYGDEFRKSVGISWDLRLDDPYIFSSRSKSAVAAMFLEQCQQAKIESTHPLVKFTSNTLYQVQLHISSPVLFFGDHYEGLLSAQVIPNDNEATKKCGKKIFSFAKNVLQQQQSQPETVFVKSILQSSLAKKLKQLLHENDELYYKVYDISTLGHEYGHTLWMQEGTEQALNVSGNFKNIEEWKATAGGLMAFFRTPGMQELRSPVCAMLLIRCIKLITKMKEVPYLPYYCEAIIHFHILGESGVLVQDAQGKIGMNLSEKNYHKMIEGYTKTYQALIQVYAQKRDATELLSQFTVREAGVMLPVHPKLREMFLGVYQKHLETGSKLA